MPEPDSLPDLIESTILCLEELKSRGVRYLVLRPEPQPTPAPGFVRSHVDASQNSLAAMESSESNPTPGPSATVTSVRSEPPPAQTGSLFAELSSPAPAVAGRPVLSAETKAQAFAELRERALVCTRCQHLAASRKNVVFGVGSIDAALMFVGEAPGADEDEQGEPFVGRAGELLTRIIQTMGLGRNEVYIGNILKCRPDTPGQSSGNRKPTPEEMQTCIPYLHSQIDLIQPKVLVALGAVAVEGLLGKTMGITKLRGHWQTYRGIPLMPTYHPSYLLRTQSLRDKRFVWEDMLQVMERLALPISDKQRAYFLSKPS